MSKRLIGTPLSAVVLAFGMHVGTAGAAEKPMKYDASCGACHNTAVAGAPKTHDEAAWKPRLEKGMDVLVESVKNGLNVMPPKGNCSDCSDAEYKELIEFMASPAA